MSDEGKHGMDAAEKEGAEKPTAGGEISDEGGEHTPDDTPTREGVEEEGLGTSEDAGAESGVEPRPGPERGM